MGIFKFKLGNRNAELQKSKLMRAYGIFIIHFLLFIGLPYAYVHYMRYYQEKMPMANKEIIVVITNLQYICVSIAYCAFIKSVCYTDADIAGILKEGLAIENSLGGYSEITTLKRKYLRIIQLKLFGLDSIIYIASLVRTTFLYQKFGEPKVFSFILFSVSQFAVTFTIFLVFSTYLYCAYLVDVLNFKFINLIKHNPENSVVCHQSIEEILLLHTTISRFVLKLSKISGLLITIFLISHFTTVVIHVSNGFIY